MVTFKFSNRALYTGIAVMLVIAAIGIAYAVAPNPGHDASQLSGVCLSDGTGCKTSTFSCAIRSETKSVAGKSSIDSKCLTGEYIVDCSCQNGLQQSIGYGYISAVDTCKCSFSDMETIVIPKVCCKLA